VPVLTVFGGPNGSGKSSIIERVAFEGKHNLLDSDAIAKRLNPNNPGQSAIAAARDVLRRTHAYIEAGQSFAVETTLAGSWILTAIQAALQQGWMVRVVYICVDTPERNIRRVRERVLQGGHDVPDEDVRRQYARSLLNIRMASELWTRGPFTTIPGRTEKSVGNSCWSSRLAGRRSAVLGNLID
jgi:predicted ABC-type ATPase